MVARHTTQQEKPHSLRTSWDVVLSRSAGGGCSGPLKSAGARLFGLPIVGFLLVRLVARQEIGGDQLGVAVATEPEPSQILDRTVETIKSADGLR